MLHIFGDSFSIPQNHMNEVFGPHGTTVTYIPLEKTWTTIVKESILGDSEYVNDSVLGCSNDYIYYKLVERESSFKEGDFVIIQPTSMHREWFFENKPYMAIQLATMITPGVDVTEEQYQAIEMYKRHLYFEGRNIIHYNMFFDSLVHKVKMYGEHKIRCLILPGFDNVPGVKGNLCEASGTEFNNEKTAIAYYDKTGDLRFNHFSEVNHKILADKIIEFFKTGKTVDLTTGFKTGIYTKETLKTC